MHRRMFFGRYGAVLLLLATLTACASEPNQAFEAGKMRQQAASPVSKAMPAEGMADDAEAEEARGGAFEPARPTVLAPQLIKTASVSLKVSDINDAARTLQSLTTRYEGTVTNQSLVLQSEDNHRSGQMTVRVPQARLESYLDDAAKVGAILDRHVEAQDVSDQVVDLESRLKNSRAEEAALRGIMNRAGKIPDVLEVSKELSRVRGEIETAQGQLNQFRQKIAYSTVNIGFSEEGLQPATSAQPGIGNAIGHAGKQALDTLYSFVLLIAQFLVWLVILILPILLILGLVFWGAWQILASCFRKLTGLFRRSKTPGTPPSSEH